MYAVQPNCILYAKYGTMYDVHCTSGKKVPRILYVVQCIPYVVHITCYSICGNRFLMYWVCIVYILSCIVSIYLVVRSVYARVRVRVYARVLYTYAYVRACLCLYMCSHEYVRVSSCMYATDQYLHTCTCEYIPLTMYISKHVE